MSEKSLPRPYEEWRTQPVDREVDAAYTFGYYLIIHCRDEALASLPKGASKELKIAVEKAVDTALHNVNDMLEGFWFLPSGPKHTVELVLSVRVHDSDGKALEILEISPNKLDLPVGYWRWAEAREYR